MREVLCTQRCPQPLSQQAREKPIIGSTEKY